MTKAADSVFVISDQPGSCITASDGGYTTAKAFEIGFGGLRRLYAVGAGGL